MRVGIVGCGAMGGVWAARLSRAGEDVSVVDASPDVVERLASEGLGIADPDGDMATGPLRAHSSADGLTAVDVLYVFVKAQHTAAAAEMAKPLVTDATTVVTLQNGWGNADVLADHYPPPQLVMGVTYHSATVRGPGQVSHTGSGPTFVGPYMTDSLDRSQTVADLQDGAGLLTTPTTEIRTEVWKKLVLNAVTLPTAALTRLNAGELGMSGTLRELLDELTRETVAVAKAMGLPVDAGERIDRIRAVLEGAGAGKPSMLQDVEAKRKTEIEVINGAVVREADRLGVAVPLNRAMTALIGGLEGSWAR